MNQSGLVSVILPVFNRPEFLRVAVAQVLAQTYRPLELILINDGSTDTTGQICDEIIATHPEMVRVIHQKNGGPGAARESGRLLAQGEFLQYFDSDDQIHPAKIEIQVAALRKQPDCGIAYCKTREFGETEESQWSQFTGEKFDLLFPRLLSGCCWPTITPLIRRAVSDSIGPWMPLRQEEDWEYDSRIAAKGIKLLYSEEPLASVFNHPGPRASGCGQHDLSKLRDRCTARLLILQRALESGIEENQPDRRHFSKNLFLLSRQCAVAGLLEESQKLFSASWLAAGKVKLKNQRLYRLLTITLGWKNAGLFCDFFKPAYSYEKDR